MAYLLEVVAPLGYYCLACIGAGIFVMGRLAHRPSDTSPTEFALRFLLGQGVLGSILHVPALAGTFTVPVVLCLTLPFACWAVVHLRKSSRTVASTINHIFCAFRSTSLSWQIAAVTVAFVLVAGGCSVAAEITDDARAFYMVLPKVVAASHRLEPLPLYEEFTVVGLLAEIQLAAMFLLGMPGGTPRLFCWLTFLAGTVVLDSLGRHAGLGRGGRIICLAMLATSSAVAWLWGSGKTEFFAAAFGLCGYYYALRSWEKDARRDAILLAGLFSGFAVVAKLSYLVAFVPGVCLLLVWKELQSIAKVKDFRETRLAVLKQCIFAGLLFGATAGLAFLPQLAKNWILYGDALKTLEGGFQWFSPETTRRIVLTYPLVLTYGKFWGQFGTMSPLWLAFFPLILLSPQPMALWNNAPLAALTTAGLAGLVIWVILLPAVPMPRYFLATLILLCVPASWSAERFSLHGRASACVIWVATLLVLASFYIGYSSKFFNFSNAYRNIVAAQKEGVPADGEHDSYSVYQALNRRAEPGARVYTLTYFKFLMRPDLIQCATRSSERPGTQDRENPERFWRHLYSLGFSYILAERAFNEMDVDSLIGSAPGWVRLELIEEKGGWAAYRIVYENPPGNVLMSTREVSPGAWDIVPIQ